jgi:hypothetical protein
MKCPSTLAKLFLLSGIVMTACSSDDDRRSEVLLNIQSGVPALDTVNIVASTAGVPVKTASIPWAKAKAEVLEIGLYIPAGVAGPVVITAQGLLVGSVVAEGEVGTPVALKAGAVVGPYLLSLSAVATTSPDGGVDAEATDGLASEVSLHHDGPTATGDAGASESPTLDSAGDTSPDGEPDQGQAPDAPSSLGFDGASDVPVPIDAKQAPDASGGLSAEAGAEAPAAQSWQPAQNIESDPASPSYYPAVVVDPVQNHVYVAWEDGPNLKVRRWNSTLASWEKIVVVENRGSPMHAALAADGKGHVVVAWIQDPMASDKTLAGAWISQTSDGISWSPPVRVASGDIWAPVLLAMARNGTARMVYPRRVATNNMPLFTAYYDGTGWVDNPTMLDAVGDSMGQSPALVVDPSGNAILIFEKARKTGGIGVGALTMTGASFSTAIVLDDATDGIAPDQRSVAINHKGEGVMVWSQSNGDGDALYARAYNPSTGWSGKSTAIVTAHAIGSVGAALDEQGTVTAAWQEPLIGGKRNLRVSRGTVTGAWSDPVSLETDNQANYAEENNATPQLALDDSGNVLLAWRKVVDSKTAGIYGSRFAAGSWLAPVQLGQRTGDWPYSLALSVSDSGLGAAAFYYWSPSTPALDTEAFNTEVALYR